MVDHDPDTASASAQPDRAQRPGGDGGGGDDSRESESPRPAWEELLTTFYTESTLWPVAIVFFLSGGAFGAALLVLASVDRNPFAALALLLIAGLSIDLGLRARRRRGLRVLAGTVAGLWLTAALLAGLAVWSGIA